MTFWPMMAIRLPSDHEIYNFSAPFYYFFDLSIIEIVL